MYCYKAHAPAAISIESDFVCTRVPKSQSRLSILDGLAEIGASPGPRHHAWWATRSAILVTLHKSPLDGAVRRAPCTHGRATSSSSGAATSSRRTRRHTRRDSARGITMERQHAQSISPTKRRHRHPSRRNVPLLVEGSTSYPARACTSQALEVTTEVAGRPCRGGKGS